MSNLERLSADNFDGKAYFFRDRQAGVSVVYDPESEMYYYNAYCLETKLMQELFTCEFDFLEDAVDLINAEFGTWQLQDLAPQKSGCGSCVAK